MEWPANPETCEKKKEKRPKELSVPIEQQPIIIYTSVIQGGAIYHSK